MQLKCTPQTSVDAVHSSMSAKKEMTNKKRKKNKKKQDNDDEDHEEEKEDEAEEEPNTNFTPIGHDLTLPFIN